MILVFQDVPTGYIVQEEVADDRTYATWKALVDAACRPWGTSVLYLVSDRAKALIQLAEASECLSMPDFFHFMHDLVKTYSLAPWARETNAPGTPRSPGGFGTDSRTAPRGSGGSRSPGVGGHEANRGDAMGRGAPHRSPPLGNPLAHAASFPPCGLGSSRTSAQAEVDLQATVEAIEVFAQGHQLPIRHAALTKVRKQLPALAALVDFWWEGVRQDMKTWPSPPCGGSGLKRSYSRWSIGSTTWLTHAVPAGKPKSGKPWRLCKAPLAIMRSRDACLPRPSKSGTDGRPSPAKRFQRTSSAVEGRNGYLSQMHHNHRGLPSKPDKAWTALHNFDCRAADGTTPASRFFRRTFPDLFETVLSKIEDLPRPRKRNQAMALTA